MIQHIMHLGTKKIPWIVPSMLALCIANTFAIESADDTNSTQIWAYELAIVRMGSSASPIRYEGILSGEADNTRRISLYATNCSGTVQGRAKPEYVDIMVNDGVLTGLVYSIDRGWQRILPIERPSGTFSLPKDPNIPKILSLALYMTVSTRSGASLQGAPDTFFSFFEHARREPQVEVTIASSWDPNGSMRSVMTTDAETCLRHPPTGRVLRKAALPDGRLDWQMRDGTSGDVIVSIQMRPIDPPAKVIDIDSVGRGVFVPAQYWAYWECVRLYRTMPAEQEQRRVASAAVTRKINDSLPEISRDTMRLSLMNLLLGAAVTSEDRLLIHAAVKTYAAELQKPGRSLDEMLIGFARLTSVMGDACEDPNVLSIIQSNMEQAIGDSGISNPYLLQYVLTQIDGGGAYWFRSMVTEAIEKTASISQSALDQMVQPLETVRLSRHVEPSDPNEATPSMKALMAQRKRPPIRGDLTWTDLETLLAEGYARNLSHLSQADRDHLVRDTLDVVSNAVGQGPFRQQRSALEKGLSRFLLQHVKNRSASLDLSSFLGGLLALSFYDTSTPEDHAMLLEQIQGTWKETEAELKQILRDNGLIGLVADETWGTISGPVLAKIVEYIDDPFWPMFKYPLSQNELSRLSNAMQSLIMNYQVSIRKFPHHPTAHEVGRLQFEVRRVLYRLPARLVDLRLTDHSLVGYRLINERFFLIYNENRGSDKPQEHLKELQYLYLGHRTDDLRDTEE